MWMEVITRNWLVWQLTSSGLNLGLINLARALPQVALALPAGVVADRFNKKRVLQSAQFITFSCYLSLFFLVLTDAIQLWHLYFFSVFMGISMSFNQPARQSLISRVVPRGTLLNAISLIQVAMNTMRVMGPAIAGLLIGFFGISSAYGVATGVFLVVILATAFLRTSEGESLSHTRSAGRQLVEGLGYVLRNKSILAIMAVALVTFTFAMPYNTLMPIVADHTLGIGAEGYGLILSVAGAGALIGGVTIASLGSVKRTSVIFLGGAFAFGGSIVLLGISPWIWSAFLIMLLLGASQSMFMAAGSATLLSRTPQELHGRVMSIYTLDRGLMPLGSTMAGALSDIYSASTALVVMGGIAMSLVIGVGALIPSSRRL